MFTSCYARLKTIQAPLEPVCISVGKPRWYKGRCEPRLAPTWAMLKMNVADYNAAYDAILGKIDPAEIAKSLGENAVLLCWEAPTSAIGAGLLSGWKQHWASRSRSLVLQEPSAFRMTRHQRRAHSFERSRGRNRSWSNSIIKNEPVV